LESAPDLVLQPMDGFDPKGAIFKETLTFRGPTLVGMHTFDDALLYVRGHRIQPGSWSILDATPTILTLMGLPVPAQMDGHPMTECS
jgi:predicted AlkP superfamily phosphohydrolase/phosphomutase